MPANNFKLFDENKQNMLNDQEYQASQQRLSGVQAGIASSMLNNKFAYQMSLVAYAITQMMNANGYDATDALVVSAFVGNLSDSVLQKVIDKATTAEAQAGTNTLKWMTPALVKSFFSYWQATQAEAQAGTNNTKWMSPARVKAFYSYMAATESMAAAGTDTTHWMSPKATKTAIDSSIRIGDIKTTVRTDLGENWLLCNGEAVSAADYPELAGILSQQVAAIKYDTTYLDSIVSVSDPGAGTNIIYANGYYVTTVYSINSVGLYVVYSNSLSGPWTAKKVTDSIRFGSLKNIAYGDGKWAIAFDGYDTYASQHVSCVARATSLDGTWSLAALTNTSSSVKSIGVVYGNGYWVSGWEVNQTVWVKYSADLITWTTCQGQLSNYSGNISLFYEDNNFVIVSSTNISGTAYALFYYTSSPTSSFTMVRTTYSGFSYLLSTSYVNGKYMLGTHAASNQYIAVFNGIPTASSTYDLYKIDGVQYVNNVLYDGTNYILSCSVNIDEKYQAGYAQGPSLSGGFALKSLITPYSSSNSNQAKSCLVSNGKLLFVGNTLKPTGSVKSVFIANETDGALLPEISVDKAYAYIKAKEA